MDDLAIGMDLFLGIICSTKFAVIVQSVAMIVDSLNALTAPPQDAEFKFIAQLVVVTVEPSPAVTTAIDSTMSSNSAVRCGDDGGIVCVDCSTPSQSRV